MATCRNLYQVLQCSLTKKLVIPNHHSSYFCSFCNFPLLMNVFVLVFLTHRKMKPPSTPPHSQFPTPLHPLIPLNPHSSIFCNKAISTVNVIRKTVLHGTIEHINKLKSSIFIREKDRMINRENERERVT